MLLNYANTIGDFYKYSANSTQTSLDYDKFKKSIKFTEIINDELGWINKKT